jgi:hypothetical protein
MLMMIATLLLLPMLLLRMLLLLAMLLLTLMMLRGREGLKRIDESVEGDTVPSGRMRHKP